MPFTTSYLYELRPSGASGNAKVLELQPDSTSINTEVTEDGTLFVGETFTAHFVDPTTEATFGGSYTYIGHDLAADGIIASNDAGTQYLFSGDPDLAGTVLKDILTEEVPVPCFLEGTKLRTPLGWRAVEDLKPGDLIMTADGRVVPIKFVHKTVVETSSLTREGGKLPGKLPSEHPFRARRLTPRPKSD